MHIKVNFILFCVYIIIIIIYKNDFFNNPLHYFMEVVS